MVDLGNGLLDWDTFQKQARVRLMTIHRSWYM